MGSRWRDTDAEWASGGSRIDAGPSHQPHLALGGGGDQRPRVQRHRQPLRRVLQQRSRGQSLIASTIFTHSLGFALFAAAPAQAKTAPPHGGATGVAVADTMLRRWPELDATSADCTGLANCFSLSFATVPPAPAPKFWEYTYGVPLMGLQRLYERTHDARYLAYIKKYVDRY